MEITFKIVFVYLTFQKAIHIRGHQCSLPAGFGDDHFRPQLIKLVPQ